VRGGSMAPLKVGMPVAGWCTVELGHEVHKGGRAGVVWGEDVVIHEQSPKNM